MKNSLTLKQKRTCTKVASFLTVLLSLISLNSISQETWEFSNAGATGRMGPTESEIDAAYAGTNLENNVVINTQGIQEWTVPMSGTYLIHALGAQGGSCNSNPGGLGADIQGEFNLNAGDDIHIAVGQMGLGGNHSAGGGGASFIYNSATGELLIAAGGGGGRTYTNNGTPNALATNNGDVAGQAGTDNSAGGGGSFSYDGGTAQGFGGHGFMNGAEGGCGHYYASCDENQGGFGGGGGGSWAGGRDGGGGGGGYSGGNGGAGGSDTHGDGGGSFNGGTEQINLGGANEGHGAVTITQLYGVSLIANTNATCPETTDGSLTAEISGGDHPYTFVWSNGESNVVSDLNTFTDQVSGLAPGEYTVTVTDVNGLETSGTYTVGPDPLEVSFDMTQTSTCDMAGDGTAEANVTGGTAPYSYSWNSGEDTQAISNKSFGSYEVTVTDANDCEPVIASVEITADDDTAPLAQVQDIEVFLDANGQASIVAEDIDNGSSDDCAIASRVIDIDSFNCDDAGGEVSVELSITDAGGNLAQADAYVTVNDTISPVAQARARTLELNQNGQVIANAQEFDDQSSDNCAINGFELDQTLFTCEDLGVNDVILTVDDIHGNSKSVATQVTIEDNLTPTAVAQNITVELDENGFASITAMDADNGSTDNCPIDSRELTINEFTCEDIGEVEVTMTVRDASGNESEATFIANVVDNVAPSIPEALSMEVYLDENGEAIFDTAPLLAEASDACGVESVLFQSPEGDINPDGEALSCEDVFDADIPAVAIDVNGNETEFNLGVSVQDTIKPLFYLESIELEMDAEGNAALTEDMLLDYASDNCGIGEIMIQDGIFTCEAVGIDQVVEITVVDMHGNEKHHSLNVMVNDMVAPEVAVQDIIIELDEEGQAVLDIENLDMTLTENCITSQVLDQTQFDCTHLGTNSNLLTVTDAGGNDGVAEFNVSVVDNISPVIEGPEQLTMCEGQVMHYRDFAVIDNCSAAMEVVEGPQEGENLEAGEYYIVLHAEDASGNSVTHLVNVSVSPSPTVDLGEDMEVESGELITLVAGLDDENEYFWNTGDETPSISFVAVESANIYVDVVTPEGCRNGDNIFIEVFTPLSTDEDNSGNSVSFFPNPTAGELNVSLSLSQNINDLQLTVMDINGKAVHQEIVPMAEDGQVINVNLSDLSDGVYLVNIQSESLNLTERIIKK